MKYNDIRICFMCLYTFCKYTTINDALRKLAVLPLQRISISRRIGAWSFGLSSEVVLIPFIVVNDNAFFYFVTLRRECEHANCGIQRAHTLTGVSQKHHHEKLYKRRGLYVAQKKRGKCHRI